MADGDVVPMKMMVTFGVRNDKSRGIMIETMETPEGIVHFFKAANVQRAKKIHVDVTEFLCEYFQPIDGNRLGVVFRTTKLKSTNDQLDAVYNMRLNKETGIAKRMLTLTENKQPKIIVKNAKILATISAAETAFQNERARRLSQLFDEAQRRRQGGGAQQTGAQQRTQQGVVQHGPDEGDLTRASSSRGFQSLVYRADGSQDGNPLEFNNTPLPEDSDMDE